MNTSAPNPVPGRQVKGLELLGGDIKQYRRDAGMSVREAAEQCGMSPATLNRIENGGMPTLLHYAFLCDWLDLSLDTYLKVSHG